MSPKDGMLINLAPCLTHPYNRSLLLLGVEVLLDVGSLANLLERQVSKHDCDGLAAGVKEAFDIHVVGSLNDLKQHLLVNLHEPLVPLIDISGLLVGISILILF